MLVIARRKGQRVVIGDVEILVTDVDRGECKLAFRAPAGTVILRGEVAEKIAAAADAERDSLADEGRGRTS